MIVLQCTVFDLQVKNTAVLSFVWRLSEVQNVLWEWYFEKCPLRRGCPFLACSFIGGSTIYTYQASAKWSHPLLLTMELVDHTNGRKSWHCIHNYCSDRLHAVSRVVPVLLVTQPSVVLHILVLSWSSVSWMIWFS